MHVSLKYRLCKISLCNMSRPETFGMALVDPRFAASRHTTAPISHIRLHPIARKLLVIFHPTEGRRLSWPECTAG